MEDLVRKGHFSTVDHPLTAEVASGCGQYAIRERYDRARIQ
jgi:hypothetical protein